MLRGYLSDYKPIDQPGSVKIVKFLALFVVTAMSATFVRGSVPIIVATPQRMKAAMKLVTDAQDLLEKGDVAGAKRNVDAVIHNDPTIWAAFYVARRFWQAKGNTTLPFRIVIKRSGNIAVVSRLLCCVTKSMLTLENTRKH